MLEKWHPEQLPEDHFKPSDTSCRDSQADLEDILEYSASVITRFCTKLDHKRKANFCISELEAKVATHQVVLEASIQHHQER